MRIDHLQDLLESARKENAKLTTDLAIAKAELEEYKDKYRLAQKRVKQQEATIKAKLDLMPKMNYCYGSKPLGPAREVRQEVLSEWNICKHGLNVPTSVCESIH